MRSADAESFMKSFWESYSKTAILGLIAASRKKGGPWDQIISLDGERDSYGSQTIPVGMIKSYFSTLINKDDQQKYQQNNAL
jgi:hypothetical protein